MGTQRRETRLFLLLLAILALGLTTVAATIFWKILSTDGLDLLDVPLLVVFAVLFLWIAVAFWTATFGFIRELGHMRQAVSPAPPPVATTFRTAIIMPIHNEQVEAVMAGIQAMYEELQLTGHGNGFDFFILSDSTDPDIWLSEEQAWAALRSSLAGDSGLYYRHRRGNEGHKSGNIRQFCQRWGRRYRYMVVLDADSLMAGETLVEMVRQMEEDPRVGLLQAPSRPVNCHSLFARLQQFAAHLYGPIFTSGYALWSQMEGNYWGHNAILRVWPFMRHCGLPVLPGKPPLGGEILSHDFVEAALMRRAGWKVIVDHDLRGSYEGCPTNLAGFAKRDQRWCQGNLQHLRLTMAHGLRPVSRLQLGMGAMSYLSSPLWAFFLLLVVLAGVGAGGHAGGSSRAFPELMIWVFVGTIALLLLPKFWALLLAVSRSRRAREFGGMRKAAQSVILETAASVAMAPILMAFHTTFVTAAFLGRTVRWGGQPRQETLSLAEARMAHARHTIAGLAGVLTVTWLSPDMLPWMAAVLLPLVFSIPISMLLSSRRLGILLRLRRLLLIHEELSPPPILRRQRRCLRRWLRRTRNAPHPFIRLVADPACNALHLSLLPAEPADHAAEGRMSRLRLVALSGGPAHLSRQDRIDLLRHTQSLRWLHVEAWKDWPIELLHRVAGSA